MFLADLYRPFWIGLDWIGAGETQSEDVVVIIRSWRRDKSLCVTADTIGA